MAAKRKTSRKPKKKSKSWFKRLLRLGLGLSLFGLLSLGAFVFSIYLGFWGPLPSSEDLQSIPQSKASLVYASNQKIIGSIYAINRDPVDYQNIPDHLLNALVATEDQRFYEHSGIDLRSLARVAIKSILLKDDRAGGGSTLTQQLLKNLYGRPDYGLATLAVNKCREMILAYRLEQIYSKKEILALYLNTVSFSENTFGISAGSRRFFNRAPRSLTIEEGAVLVGLLKANTYYNPRLNPEPALERRNLVLALMSKQGYIEEGKLDSLQKIPLTIDYHNLDLEGPAPYFLSQVKKELSEILSNKVKSNGENWDPKKDGLRIYTSLDADAQESLNKAFQGHLAQWQQKFDAHWANKQPWYKTPSYFDRQVQASSSYKRLAAQGLSEEAIYARLQEKRNSVLYHPAGDKEGTYSSLDSIQHFLKLLRGASLLMDPQTGAIRAWIGGPDFRYLPFDAARAPHTMASTVKPFVMAAALEEGADPCTFVSAERRVYPDYEDWSPRNYNNRYQGFYSMRGTLKNSINTATIAWYFNTGPEAFYRLAQRMGIANNWADGPSVALGSSAVSPLELAQAYSVFANGGMSVEAYFIERIETAEGELLYQHEAPERQRIIEERTARYINYFLQATVEDGTAAKLPRKYGAKFKWAAKTGTSQNYSDAWLLAYSPNLVSVNWMGGASPIIRFRTGSYGSGSAMALPIFGRFLSLHEGQLKPFTWPSLSEEDQQLLDCPDFKEGNLLDELRDLLREKPGKAINTEEEESASEAEEESWFKRLFKSKKKD